MRTFEYVCFEIVSSSQQPLCCFVKTEIKSDFKCVFVQLYQKSVNYGLVIIIRFRH